MSSDLNWQHQDTGLACEIAPSVKARDGYDGELCFVARPPQALHLGDREKLSGPALLNRPPSFNSGAHTLPNPGGKSSRTDSNFSIFSLIKRPRRSSTIVNNVEGVPSFLVSQS